ncbi:hypothetical protein [Marinobacterium aestuariivivens]|uniref:DUF2147 domain-containing protein n=1 Tax=Marinobacterium aestuariivivens TaxID=1698799 RepID=A0ABW2A957_9GAMM
MLARWGRIMGTGMIFAVLGVPGNAAAFELGVWECSYSDGIGATIVIASDHYITTTYRRSDEKILSTKKTKWLTESYDGPSLQLRSYEKIGDTDVMKYEQLLIMKDQKAFGYQLATIAQPSWAEPSEYELIRSAYNLYTDCTKQ